MSTELQYLVWVTLVTAFCWIPYILHMIRVRGLIDAVGYPSDPKPMAPWAERMKKAHYNAVENLVVFAPLVLVAHAIGTSNGTTVAATQVYFVARIIHLIAYTFAVPWLRTLSFIAGWGAIVALGLQLI